MFTLIRQNADKVYHFFTKFSTLHFNIRPNIRLISNKPHNQQHPNKFHNNKNNTKKNINEQYDCLFIRVHGARLVLRTLRQK